MNSCLNCKWARLDTWGSIECQYPVPAWLVATIRGLEDSRGINRLGDPLLANEVSAEHPYTKCPTFQPKESPNG